MKPYQLFLRVCLMVVILGGNFQISWSQVFDSFKDVGFIDSTNFETFFGDILGDSIDVWGVDTAWGTPSKTYYETRIENINLVGKEFVTFFKTHPEIKEITTDILIGHEGKVDFPEDNNGSVTLMAGSAISEETRLDISRLIKRLEIYFPDERGYLESADVNYILILNEDEKGEIIINARDHFSIKK